MKIAILSEYSGVIDRGVETWTRELATRLNKMGHDVCVFQGGEETDLGYKKIIVKQEIYWNLRSSENKVLSAVTYPYWGLLVLFFTLRCIVPLVRFHPDIILPTNGGFQTFIVRILTKILGIKMVVTGHAGIGASDKWNILARPDYFVSPSKRGEKWVKNLFIAKGLSVTHIPHGVDLSKFTPNAKKTKVPLDKPVVLTVSSFEPYKRIELVIKAVARLKAVSLLVIGGDREGGNTDKLARKFLGKRYLKLRVKPNEMPSYYASCDVFSLVSEESEAFGIVYLEALASNLPVVATKDSLREEIIGQAGILVDPTDVDAYSNALEQAANKDWGNLPRKQAGKFNWDDIARQYEELFNKLI